ncbi:MAG: GNAT family N-acetyltransferase, partial [Micromonosporaceae bacterium]
MLIRDATPEDWDAIWPLFRAIVAAGDTYAYRPDLGKEEARDLWLLAAPNRTVVAVDDTGAVVGTAKMNNNQAGNGSH